MNGQALLELDQVSFSYPSSRNLVLEDVSLRVQSGEFLGIVGPNGGGKTTLLKLILGLLEPSRGRVMVQGSLPALARRQVGYVPQATTFSRDFPISVQEVVLLGRLGRTRLIGGYTARDRRIVQQALEKTEMLPLRDQRLGNLSGGQLQRALIARALASEPNMLILDEPTANIDLRGEKDIFDLLQALQSKQTIIVVSHDIAFISTYVTRVACLNRTLICHTTEAITGEVIERLYGRPVRLIRHTH
ncbi:MAG: metal ABC transporter ATP-binding protein [Gammaproteobacteria bacterium]